MTREPATFPIEDGAFTVPRGDSEAGLLPRIHVRYGGMVLRIQADEEMAGRDAFVHVAPADIARFLRSLDALTGGGYAAEIRRAALEERPAFEDVKVLPSGFAPDPSPLVIENGMFSLPYGVRVFRNGQGNLVFRRWDDIMSIDPQDEHRFLDALCKLIGYWPKPRALTEKGE